MDVASQHDDFFSSRLVEHGEQSPRYSLIFDDFGPSASVFENHGSEAGGYAWHAACVGLVEEHAPELAGRLQYDPESSMFAAYSTDRAALLHLAELIRQAQSDHAMLDQALGRVNLSDYD
ncbi:Imm51 family immunity protein [Deinococcus koreensis]|uniref:Immunity protein 51 n=1 Tax=Deinococcus koreensis TaxID=2054903 RepID=A0A2K3UTW6_9DEIO|nr:Imm51 family immunity protein [Deinococcus koreensis]PNY79971.1 hypothetical protein CVO96_00130 [Deinococcus koreensis]